MYWRALINLLTLLMACFSIYYFIYSIALLPESWSPPIDVSRYFISIETRVAADILFEVLYRKFTQKTLPQHWRTTI